MCSEQGETSHLLAQKGRVSQRSIKSGQHDECEQEII